MKASLSCCLRAVVRQASAQRQQQLAELQGGVTAVAACGQRSRFGSQHRQFHSSHTPEFPDSVESASQASTSASRSTFPIPSRKPQSTRGDVTRASGGRHHQPSVEQVTSHLNTLFEGLQRPIPPELAWRMVTHKGAVPANTIEAVQHNDKLSLIGRRVLRLYLSVFLHSQEPNKDDSLDSMTDLVERLAHTHTLGRYVASNWNLERNMHWQEVIGPDGRPSGLEKISGQAVEAILGGMYRQYGAAIALQIFNSRILPFLPLHHSMRKPAIALAQKHGDLSKSLADANKRS